MADSLKSPRPAGSGLLSPATGGAALLGAGFRFGAQKQTQGSVRWFENKEEEVKKGSTRLSAYMSSRPSKFIGSSPQELGMALVQAATDGDLEKVDRLLLAGANVDFETEKGYTALIKACRMQRVEVVRRLLAYNPDVNKASKNGWTAMIEACRVGHQGLAEELLEKGANIDCTNVMGWTPIVEACRNRHFHVIKMLVARGSDIDHLDKDNMAPLDHTSRALKDIRAFLKGEWRKKHKEQWAREQKLRAEGKWPEPKEIPPGDQLATAANKGDLDTVKDLVENKKFSVDLTTVNGAYTPLIMACRGQHYNVVEYLLNQGADVNKHSTAGWTPCIESSRVGNLAILQLLVARGGDINKTNAFGWHGLIEACRNVNYDVVEWSIDNGSKVEHIDEDGEKAMDHTTHPWIRGLLQGGPRKVLKKVLRQFKPTDPQRIPAALDSIREQISAAITAYDKARETGSAEAVMHPTQLVQALFEVVVQELDPVLTAAVLDLDVKWPSATSGKDEGVREAVEFSPTNIVRAIVQLAAPSASEWSAKRAAETAASLAKSSAPAPVLWKAEEVLQVVLERLFPELYQDEPKFEGLSDKEREAKQEEYSHHLAVVTERRSVLLNSPDSTTSRTAAVECAWKYAKEADKITGANRSELPFVCTYFFDLMVAILRNGAKFTGQDSTGASVLHYILSTVPLLKDNKHAVAVVLKQTRQLLDEFGYDMTRQVVNAKVGLAEKTPLCYLVCANPHEEREPILMMLLRMGALYPEPTDPRSKALEFEQARLMALVTQAMKDDLRGPYNSWNIMVCAVRNGDSKMVSRIMQSKLPVFMTNPELGDQAKITLPGPETDPETGVVPVTETDVDLLVDAAIREDTDGDDYDAWRTAKKTLLDTRKEQPNFSYSASMGWARVDMAGVEECLLHVAIEQEDMEDNNKEIFDLLLEYSEAEAKKITVNGTEYSYPWNEDAGENPSLTWLNSFGQNSFHVCGNKKIEGPSATNTYYFRELLKRDVHAMVTRVDVSGWAALHYASYHNKPEIVNALIETRIDLQQPTSSFMHHTPLHLAALKGNWSITLALLAAGVAVDVVDQDGCTPLTLGMLARQNLVDKGADDGSGNEEEDAAKKEDEIKAAAEKDLDKAADGAAGVESKLAWEEQMKDHQKGSALDREIQTYNFTIEALLNHGASIHFACEASGKDLTALMDVDEAWIAVSTKLNSIEEREKLINDEYLDKLLALEKESKTAEQRHAIIRAAKELRDRKQKVWGSVRRQIYEDKEYQVVIEQYYDNAVRKARFSKLTRFSILLLLLITVGIMETTRNNHTAYYLQKTMIDSLATNSGPEGGVSFADISLNRQDFWKFAKGPFLDVIYPDKHDSFWAPFNTSLPTGVVNHYNALIGAPRLRQIRSRTMACDVPKAFRQLPGGSLCFGDVDYEARYPFGPNNEYTWQSAYYLGTGERDGSLGSYPGSGYAVVLPGNSDDDSRERAEAALSKLEEDNWLDAATRALFLELTLYNPHENHFLLANMLIEFPLSGGAVPSWDMEVVPLRRYNTRYDASVLLLLELLVLFFTFQHGYAEFVQFLRSDMGSYWSSFYNWMDIIIVIGVPFNTFIQLLSILNAFRIDWDSRNTYVSVERQYWLGTLQTNLYSVIVFAGCLKLFDYLSVFRGLYRLIVMIEMMAKQLVSFVVILTLFLFSFTAAEYVAYGYKDETSYTVEKGMLARVFGLFSGDPVVFGHTDGDHALGTIYVMVFLISVSMVLMNLIVAVMTAAYEEAQNQSGGELAERQYEKMNSMRLTKRRTYRLVGANGEISNVIQRSEAEDLITFLDRFDVKLYELVAHIWELFEDWNDKRRANSLQREKELERVAQQKKFDEASALLKGALPEFGTADVIEYRAFTAAPTRRDRAQSMYGKVKTQ